MSATENDDLDLPPTADDAVSTGAAADSADRHDRLKGLPRLLRYAMLIIDRAGHIEERLIAEINELCPQQPHNAAWAALQRLDTGLALAAERDRRAVTQNEPSLRSLADCVRLGVFADTARFPLLRGVSQGRKGAGSGVSCDLRIRRATALLRSGTVHLRLGSSGGR